MFKISVTKRTKFEREGTTVKCTIYYDIKELIEYIMNGPAGLTTFNKEKNKIEFTPAENTCSYSNDENKFLKNWARATAKTIVQKLHSQKVILYNGHDCYVTGVAKLNPDDPAEQFDKMNGRRIANAKAELELNNVSMAILNEMSSMAARLNDCTQWMLRGNPDNIPTRISRAKDSIQRAIDIACNCQEPGTSD